MKFCIIKHTTALLSILVLTACSDSKPPTFGERLSNRGDDVQELGEQWSEGNDLIKKGTALRIEGTKDIETAEKNLSSARTKVEKGEAMITKGLNLKNIAESVYREKFNAPLVK